MSFLRELFQELHNRAELLASYLAGQRAAEQQHLVIAQNELLGIKRDAEEYACACTSTQRAAAGLKALGREYHRLSRDLGILEEYLVGHVVHLNDHDRSVSAVSRWLWEGFGLPGCPPLVIASTSNYYNTVPRYNIVFTPVSASGTLLTIPDVIHEFGHLLHARHLTLFGPRFMPALNAHVYEFEARAAQISRPIPPNLINQLRWTWTEGWAEEIACDTFATVSAGAPYAWCNLMLCMKRPEVHSFGSHPADSCRTANIHRLLRRAGFGASADHLDRVWDEYCKSNAASKPRNFDDFHSADLVLSVVEDVCEVAARFRRDAGVVQLLNELWTRFAAGDEKYRYVEREIYETATRTSTSG